MNKKVLPFHYLVVITLTLAGCAGRTMIRKGIDAQHCSLAYLHDSPQATAKKDAKINIDEITIVNNLPDSAIVAKKRIIVIPALIFYVWHKNYECYIGKKSIQEDIPGFVHESFMEEAQRSGSFQPTKEAGEYKLRITIDTIRTSGAYKVEGHFIYGGFFYSYRTYQYAGPCDAYLSISYSLEKNGRVIAENTFAFDKKATVLKKRAKGGANLRKTFTTQMTECISLNIKAAMEKIVEEVNTKI